MTKHEFLRGMTVGIVAGTAIGMSFAPKRKTLRGTAGKAIKTVGEIVENVTDAMGM